MWLKACATLRSELGEATFGSWVAQAALHEEPGGGLVLVTPTGIAADWIRRNAWRRISEVWAQNDPDGRCLLLKSKVELEASGRGALRLATVDGRSAGEAPAPGAPDKAARMPRPTGLQERFTFDTFVPGPTNEFAPAVARRVASWADGHFNPVLFHAPYGFGKTHLLNALAWEAARSRPDKRVIYLTAEKFLSSFVKAVMERSTAGFKEELRAADLLLIDDAHFVAGKTSTQEELFQTLTALLGEGRRVVLSSDRPPSALTEMDARLRSHLSSGLVCGMEPADRSLRLAILERKLDVLCRQQGLRPMVARPRQAAMWLAKQLTTRSLPDIGRRFGGRDHTTVLHAVRRIEELKALDAPLAADLEALIRKLRG